MIYVLQARSPVGLTHRGPYKIGYSADPTTRCTDLQPAYTAWSGLPDRLEVLTTLDGDLSLERALHALFHRWRIPPNLAPALASSEWYAPVPAVSVEVERLRAGKPSIVFGEPAALAEYAAGLLAGTEAVLRARHVELLQQAVGGDALGWLNGWDIQRRAA